MCSVLSLSFVGHRVLFLYLTLASLVYSCTALVDSMSGAPLESSGPLFGSKPDFCSSLSLQSFLLLSDLVCSCSAISVTIINRAV